MGACIVLLMWSRSGSRGRFRDLSDVRIIVPFVRWNDGFLPRRKGNSPLNDDYVLMRGDAKIRFKRKYSDRSERFTYISTAWN